jgi:hypothetical protein
MRKSNIGWSLLLAGALVIPCLSTAAYAGKAKAAKADDVAVPTAGMSKEDQEKLKEHNKLRAEIKKVKFPAAKADIVSHVKGLKADDKKWFTDTLPEKTYATADDVFSALGWETTPPAK